MLPNRLTNTQTIPTVIWKTIQSCIPKNLRNHKTFSKDDESAANEFDTFFTSVGQVAVDKIIR